MRDFYKILLVSQSGKGKTYSFRNLNPKSTLFLNAENKPLPFRNQFDHYYKVESLSDLKSCIETNLQNPLIDCVVIDSLSSCFDWIMEEARRTRKGYDVYTFNNSQIRFLLNYIKKINREVFLTAHYEWVGGEEESSERRVKVKGKEWEGLIEKEFSMVLFADRGITKDGKVDAWFDFALKNSSAKCPPDIFGEDVLKMPNDSKLVLDKILDFTGDNLKMDSSEKRKIQMVLGDIEKLRGEKIKKEHFDTVLNNIGAKSINNLTKGQSEKLIDMLKSLKRKEEAKNNEKKEHENLKPKDF